MKYFYFISLLVINRISFRIHKDSLNPIFICSTMWFILPLLYEILSSTSSNYYKLSDRFYFMILSFMIPFIVINVMIIKGYRRKKQIKTNDIFPHINNLLHFCISCNFILIMRILMICRTLNIAHAINNFRVIVTETSYLITPDIKLLLYIFSITPPLFCYISIYNSKVKKIEFIVFVLEFFLMTLLYVSKGRLMKYFIMTFIILLLKNKLNPKVAIFSFITVFVLIYFMTISRDQSFMKHFSFMDYIFVYLLSPLPAFDMLINGDINFGAFTGGSQTFAFLFRVAAKFGLYTLSVTDKMFVNIPAKQGFVPTNVYTAFGKSYMDFGNIGCAIYGILIALWFGSMYRMFATSKKREYVLFYLLSVYCLVFQFFGDLFFGFFSMVIQDFLCATIVSRKLKISERKLI